MNSLSTDRVLTAEEVQGALAAHGLGLDRAAGAAIVLALNDPLRVVWANRTATAMFETAEPAELFDQVFAGRGRDGLAAAVHRLPPGGGVRTERLRLFKGFRTRTLTVTISRSRLPDGDDVFVLAIPTAEPRSADRHDVAVSTLQETPAPTVVAADPPPAAAPASSMQTAPAARAGPGTRRFVWQTDAAHRMVALTGAPPELAGLAAGTWAGKALPDLLAACGADPDDTVATALQGGQPVNGLHLRWPLTDGATTVPVTLGAVPIRGTGGMTDGFRGFGVADFSAVPDALRPSPPPTPLPVTEEVDEATPDAPDEAGRNDAAPDPVDAADPIAGEPMVAEPMVAEPMVAEPMPAVDPLPAPPAVKPAFSSSKVVALRPYLSTGAAPAEVAPPHGRRRDDPPADMPTAQRPEADPVNLSSVEHFNFTEIARTLKGELGPAASGDDAMPADHAAAVLAAMPVASLVVAEGRLQFASATFLRLSGYPSLAALDRAGGLAHLLGGLDPAEIADAEGDRAFPIVDASGAVMLVEGRAAMLPWSGASALVLTLRHAADEVAQVESLNLELRRRTAEAAHARALLDRVSDASAIVDAQGRIVMLSRAGEALFGMHETGIVGESIGTLLSVEAQSAALGAVLGASAAGPDAEPGSLLVTGRRPSGGTLSLRMTPRALGPGKVGVVLQDLTEIEGLRRDIHRLRAELDHGTGVRADFLGRVSHEIRTPLNAILGFAEIILDERFGPVGNARYKEYLTDIHAAGQQVIDYVGDLLDLSKMQAGRLELAVTSVDVNRVISDIVGKMQAQAHRERVIVRLSLMQHLPNALVDERALRQIMTNILSNAIAFNEPGGQVIVSTAPLESGAIAVRVRDTGVGMSDTELATVMEPIKQISLGKAGSGNGLGLPLTHALVEANQATMSIQSRKHEGTLVEIALQPAPAGERSNPAA